ncbi:MAG: aldolase/citrate lyase family protein [Chloroflexota bacterium]|nr:aldolase/citrate lyase family protein [Chloroflexota bacterium]
MPRVNKVVELWEQGQPVYYTGVHGELTYEAGVGLARTWADYISIDMEHGPFDLKDLQAFMRGLAAGGPTKSGHRTPAVVVTPPVNGVSEEEVRANAWMFRQLLARGIHGILLCHAESPAAVKAFVECCRYPFQTIGQDKGLGVGRRGAGGQAEAAEIWGLSVDDYLERADPSPLNPKGELMLGLKIENRRALANAEVNVKTPGISFAEWGPGDMAMSFGYPNRHDPPYPKEMLEARNRVLAACKAAGAAFLEGITEEDVVDKIKEGVRIGAGRGGEKAADKGRRYTKRTMPW